MSVITYHLQLANRVYFPGDSLQRIESLESSICVMEMLPLQSVFGPWQMKLLPSRGSLESSLLESAHAEATLNGQFQFASLAVGSRD